MARQSVVPKKKRGPPATGKGIQVQVRLQPYDLEALDLWMTFHPEVTTRPEAIRRALMEWLASEGIQAFPPRTKSKPTDPATDAVEAMDAAIVKDRAKPWRRKR